MTKLVYCCLFCCTKIFETNSDLCWKSPKGKHQWCVSEEKENNSDKKEVIYV